MGLVSRMGEAPMPRSCDMKIWIDGELLDREHAHLSVFDHGVLYGDGVFEGIRSYNGKIFECANHLRRLFDSAKSIRLDMLFTARQLEEAMYATMKANNLTDCYFRIVITRGPGDLGIDPRKSGKPVTYIIADQVKVYAKELYEKGISVISSSLVRQHPNACSPRVKSLNYLNNILAKIEANDAGAHDAVMYNHVGDVAEMTAANIFVVRDEVVCTPTTACGILEGVTRNVILGLCGKLSIAASERRLQRHDLYVADEIFVTGTGAEVMPVTRVDGRTIGAGVCGPITQKLLDAFHRLVRG